MKTKSVEAVEIYILFQLSTDHIDQNLLSICSSLRLASLVFSSLFALE